MIHKIIKIQNCGRFKKFTPSEADYGWNGIFGKKNTIYAENGSGKTTFTQILKSLAHKDCDLVEKRKSLETNRPIDISFLVDRNKTLSYNTHNWSSTIPYVEVYDNYYSESNMYIVSLGNYEAPSIFYEIVPDGYDLVFKIKKLLHKRSNYAAIIRRTKHNISLTKDLVERNRLVNIHKKQLKNKSRISEEINRLEQELNIKIELIEKQYIELTNRYLRKFNPNLEITKANKKGHQLVYYINVNGIEVRSDVSNIPLKHTLSEGDKSSLSLSFFLARLDLLPHLENRIVVFDDPISSFDTRRRMMTISILSRIASRTKQFFLLSHDIHFVKDFYDNNHDSLNLKIVYKNESSVFVRHDIDIETMTGIYKDIYTLKKYLSNGANTDFEKREVIRCIRPVVEGIFRIKYFFKDTEWLGDFLKKIQNSDKQSPLYRLREHYDDLSDINDYCKPYHHSNPKYMDIPIFDEELKLYVGRTLDVLAYI